ncbi:MAG: ABC transporter permease [Candidatus Aminicenantales bacterium]
MRIKAIAANAFKEAVRDRVLYLLVFFAVVVILFSQVLGLLTVGERVKVVKDVGLASISLFGALMAILVGTGLVYKEIDKKTIYTLLAKPIHRFQFLLGKFLGLILTLFIMIVMMSIIFLVVVFSHSLKFEWRLLGAIYLIFIELCLITSVAIFFSTFSSPILSSLFSLSFYLIGHLSWGFQALIQKMKPGATRAVVKAVYLILPDLENFNIKTEVVHALPLPFEHFVLSTLYGIFYALFVLTIAFLIFKNRDFI